MDKNNNLCGFQTLSSHTRYTFPDYKPRSPWLNADLQTLCNKIAPPEHQLDKYVHSPLLLPLEDGSGDALVATLYLPDMPEHNNRSFSTPLIVFIHGLGGSSQAIYVNTSAEYFLAEGYPVLSVNL